MRQLQIPPAALADAESFEIIRVWAADGQQHVTIQTELQGGPEEWGFLLAQLARHMAHAYTTSISLPYPEAVDRIKAGFDQEWDAPTGEPTGRVL